MTLQHISKGRPKALVKREKDPTNRSSAHKSLLKEEKHFRQFTILIKFNHAFQALPRVLSALRMEHLFEVMIVQKGFENVEPDIVRAAFHDTGLEFERTVQGPDVRGSFGNPFIEPPREQGHVFVLWRCCRFAAFLGAGFGPPARCIEDVYDCVQEGRSAKDGSSAMPNEQLKRTRQLTILNENVQFDHMDPARHDVDLSRHLFLNHTVLALHERLVRYTER